jgi:hypothetical protein
MNASPQMPGEAEHATPSQVPTRPTGNPLGTSLNVVVSVPDTIDIRMVNASTLSDYEMWIFIASVLWSAVIGFGVATVQAFDSSPPKANAGQLLWTTLTCAVIFVVTTVKALWLRHFLTKSGKVIALKAREAIEEH